MVIPLEDGYRESRESCAALLRGLKPCGLPVPKLTIADSAPVFWAALYNGIQAVDRGKEAMAER